GIRQWMDREHECPHPAARKAGAGLDHLAPLGDSSLDALADDGPVIAAVPPWGFAEQGADGRWGPWWQKGETGGVDSQHPARAVEYGHGLPKALIERCQIDR